MLLIQNRDSKYVVINKFLEEIGKGVSSFAGNNFARFGLQAFHLNLRETQDELVGIPVFNSSN
jgi:hypothetical protein